MSHPTATECTFFSSAPESFSRIDHILGHNASLNKVKKLEMISFIFDQKLQSNGKREFTNYTNTWRLNNTLLDKHRVLEEVRGERLKLFEPNNNENTTYQTYGTQQQQYSDGRLYTHTHKKERFKWPNWRSQSQ